MSDDNNNNRTTIAVSREIGDLFKAKKRAFDSNISTDAFLKYLLDGNLPPNEQTGMDELRISPSDYTPKKMLSSKEPDTEEIYKIISFDFPESGTPTENCRNLWTYIMSLLILLDDVKKGSSGYKGIVKILNYIFDSIDNIFSEVSSLNIPDYNDVEYVHNKVISHKSNESENSIEQQLESNDSKLQDLYTKATSDTIKSFLLLMEKQRSFIDEYLFGRIEQVDNNELRNIQDMYGDLHDKEIPQTILSTIDEQKNRIGLLCEQRNTRLGIDMLDTKYSDKYVQIHKEHYNKIIAEIEKAKRELEAKESIYRSKYPYLD